METLDVFDLARSADTRSGSLALAVLPRLAASLVSTEGSVAWSVRGATDTLGRPALTLDLAAPLALRCDRCGGRLDLNLAVSRNFFFVSDEAALAAIPVDDAPEEALLGSTHFDLAGLIEDEAILQLPISPRHARQRDCRPAVPLGSAAQERPHPFAQLAGLRDQLSSANPGPADHANGVVPDLAPKKP